jgi:hypothetical protein
VPEREDRRRSSVVEVDQREHPAAVAHDRELPLAHGLDQPIVFGAVEAAVAKHDPARGRDRLVEIPHRGERLGGAFWRLWIERILLGLHRPALARVPHAGEALGDEAGHACLPCGGQQSVSPFCPQPVGLPEAAVEVPREAGI